MAQDAETPQYPPDTPASASAQCIGDIPYFSFQVDFGPEFAGETVTITLQNPEGDDFVYVRTLGANGTLSGNDILWPGANDSPPDWPGWILNEDGDWVEADDGFLWARGTITVTFEVNPTQTISATYPPATVACANPPNSDTPPPPPARRHRHPPRPRRRQVCPPRARRPPRCWPPVAVCWPVEQPWLSRRVVVERKSPSEALLSNRCVWVQRHRGRR